MSKDNRIDLTQFEGIGSKKHFLHIEKTPTDGFHWSVGFENDVEASMSVSSEFGEEIHEEADRFFHAIDKLPDLLAELKRCYDELDRPKVTIDEWGKEGPCVTVYLEGKEYVGILREYNASE